MRMMDAAATEKFNQILRDWRREGKKIGWGELNQAFRLASKEAEDQEVGDQGPPPRKDDET